MVDYQQQNQDPLSQETSQNLGLLNTTSPSTSTSTSTSTDTQGHPKIFQLVSNVL